MNANGKLSLDNSLTNVELTWPGGEVTNHQLDMMEVVITFQDLERAHDLPEQEGKKIPTMPFIEDLKKACEKWGIHNLSTRAVQKLWGASFDFLSVTPEDSIDSGESLNETRTLPGHTVLTPAPYLEKSN